MKCHHEKVFANELLLSYPPKRRWICKKCLEEGMDTMGAYNPYDQDEYSKLKEKKNG